MAENHSNPIIPYLLYNDVSAALGFLERAFGFEPYGDPVTGPDGIVCHAAMKLGEGVVMMGCPGPDYQNPRQLGHITQSLYVMVDDVDRHFEQARRARAEVLEEPHDTEYGARRYGAVDPEGHQWYFAQHSGRQ
jgi:uncharacterized glyoxalase superfamily protein PhnB